MEERLDDAVDILREHAEGQLYPPNPLNHNHVVSNRTSTGRDSNHIRSLCSQVLRHPTSKSHHSLHHRVTCCPVVGKNLLKRERKPVLLKKRSQQGKPLLKGGAGKSEEKNVHTK